MMKRIQVYFDEPLFQTLEALSRKKKTTISALARKALEKIYGKKASSKKRLKAFQSVGGIWKDRKDLPSTEEYIRSLRKDTRTKRLKLP